MVNINDYKLELEGEIEEKVSVIIREKFKDLNIKSNVSFDPNIFTDPFSESVVDSRIIHWVNEFSMKAMHLEYNYGYMMMYYIKLDGVDIYKDFTADNIGNHFWFSYEVESLLNRLYTAVDYIIHILDEKYSLRTPTNSQFRSNVIRGLHEKNSELSDFIRTIGNDTRYKHLSDLRNNFMHNHSPLIVTAGVSEEEGVITVSTGEYVIASEIVRAVDDFIDILQLVVKKINEYL